MRKNEPKELLPPEKKRDVVVVAKVTKKQREHIQNLAAKCGMTVSDYILARCYNYEPKARLTEEETAELQNLVNIRADLVNYTSALHGMDNAKRKEMFNNYRFMLGWIKKLGELANRIEDYLSKVNTPNKVPS